MELKRDEIVKALECCKSAKLTKCYDCPREQEDGHCMYRLNEDALTLIKQLTEENERLHKNIETYRGRLKARDKEIDNLNKTNIQLIENRYGIESGAYISIVGKEKKIEYRIKFDTEFDLISKVKADTVREMKEKLHARKVSYGNITFRVVPIDDIDQIAKEMLEGANENV